MRARLVACIALLAALAPTPAGSADPDPKERGRERPQRAARRSADYDAPTPAWREGPVRYLLGKEDDAAYRGLETEEERARFIQRFWSSRDPVPTTPENEYRTRFLKRVEEADRLFTESTKPGWKTDRGKIYILLGPPDDLEQSAFTRERRADVVVWTYRDPPAGAEGGINSTIRFVKDNTGEYRLSSNLPRSLEFLGSGFQVQAMQMKSVPEPLQVLDTIVSSQTFFNVAPFRTHHDFLRAADGGTFTVLTLGARESLAQAAGGTPPGPPDATQGAPAADAGAPAGTPASSAAASGAPRFEVIARLAGEPDGRPSYDFAGASALRSDADSRTGGADAYTLYQAGEVVKPGRYAAYYGIIDRRTNELYSFREEITVPDLQDGGFSLSGITLASRIERIDGAARGGYSAPFVLGNLKVLPRPDDAFRNDEDLVFYYQVYAPTTDPIDGRPDLDLEYRFFIVDRKAAGGEPALTPLGQPIHLTREQDPVQAYSLPLTSWPRATYHLMVRVTDNLSGRQSSGEATFRIP